MGNNQSDIIRGNHAIQAFVDAHPQWSSVKRQLSTSQREGWKYIHFQGSEIGRVKVSGGSIIAESLWGYTKLGE
jgi:hypothetical protein